MHEFSLTKNLLNIALQHAGAKRIVHVNLTIGEFSDECEESIQFYWDDLAKNTPAEKAKLSFRHVDAEVKCLACNAVFHPKEGVGLCPNCRSNRLRLISGDEVKLESIDVE